jgi:drug/metabolite transporter (DMT)-like permease
MYSGVALSGNMSSVAIAAQLGVPFATLLSIGFLGERIHWRRWLGIGMSSSVSASSASARSLPFRADCC